MGNKSYFSIGLLTIGLVFSSTLLAEGKFYVFSDIGTSANTDYSFTTASSPLIKNDINYVSYRLGAGYDIPISQHFSVGAEAAYNYYGDEDYYFLNGDQMSVKFSAEDVLFVTAYHFNTAWEAHIKTGAAYEEVDVSENYLSGNLSEKAWVPEAAIGLSYHINQHWSVHGDFSYLMGWEDDSTNIPDITIGWLGIDYWF